MRNERVRIADGIDLSVDRWDAAPRSGGRTAAVPDATTVPDAATVPDATAPTFVLVHGLASNARLWDGVAVRLAELGHPVVAVDQRGHGGSSKPDTGYDIPTVAGDLGELIERLGLDRPIVAGQSWGGNVVLELPLGDRRLRSAASSLSTAAGSSRRPGTPTGMRVSPRWRRRGSSAARWSTSSATSGRAHPDWPETGIQGTLANFEVRADGTVAPWLTYDRHIAILRGLWDDHPSARYADVRPSPSCSWQPARPTGSRSRSAAGSRAPPGRCPGRGSSGWWAITTSMPSTPGALAELLHDAVADGFFR